MSKARARLRAAATQLKSPAIAAYAILGATAGASFLTTILLARLAGASVIGDYTLAMSTANLLTCLAILGLDRTLVREIAGDLRIGDRGRARTVTRAIVRRVAAVAALVALAYTAVLFTTPLLAHLGGDPTALGLVAISILAWPMLRLGWSGLRATGSPFLGQLFEGLPTLLMTAAVLTLWIAAFTPTAVLVTALAFGFQLACAAGAWLLLRPTLRAWPPAGDPVEPGLLASGLPFMAILFLQVFSEWIILAQVQVTAGAADVGAFRVAFQVAGLVSMIITTTEAYVAPRLAGDFRAGRPDLAWQRHRRGTIMMMLLAAPVLAVALLAPGRLLGLAFGPEFTGAATALAILAAGQLVNVARGPLGSMLLMAGHDRVQLALTVGGLAIVLVASFTLIPRYGITGAAIAQVAPLLFRSIAGYILARRLIPRTRTDQP